VASSKYTKIYWDTSCFLCFLNRKEEKRRKICEDILSHAQSGDIVLYTSTYTIAEVIRPKAKALPGAAKLTAQEIDKINGMFQWPWLRKIDVDQRVAMHAVTLARDYNLYPADAVHAASAILRKAQVLQRWDRDFNRIKHLIKVEDPQMITLERSLFEDIKNPIGPVPEP
jgi:predicted nucleic acid-binding protein